MIYEQEKKSSLKKAQKISWKTNKNWISLIILRHIKLFYFKRFSRLDYKIAVKMFHVEHFVYKLSPRSFRQRRTIGYLPAMPLAPIAQLDRAVPS